MTFVLPKYGVNQAIDSHPPWMAASNLPLDLTVNMPYNNVKNDYSSWLVGYYFFDNIPNDAIIIGIEVTIRKRQEIDAEYYDHAVNIFTNQIDYGVSLGPSGDNLANPNLWPTDSSVISYGGRHNTWGLSLRGSDMNGSILGVGLSAIGTGDVDKTCYVHNMKMQIYYVSANQIMTGWDLGVW
jgi:hypothetical protein